MSLQSDSSKHKQLYHLLTGLFSTPEHVESRLAHSFAMKPVQNRMQETSCKRYNCVF